MNRSPRERSKYATNSFTAVVTIYEVGRGYPKIAGIARDYMLSKVSIENDSRRERHEAQSEAEAVRLFLAVVGDEYLGALSSGITTRERRATQSSAA